MHSSQISHRIVFVASVAPSPAARPARLVPLGDIHGVAEIPMSFTAHRRDRPDHIRHVWTGFGFVRARDDRLLNIDVKQIELFD